MVPPDSFSPDDPFLSKFHDIEFILRDQFLCALIIIESKLDSDVDSSHFQMKNYQLFRRDRTNKGGGGVMVYIKKSIGITEPTIDLTSLNEIIALKLSLPGNKTIGLIAAYRPPHYQNEESFLEYFLTYILWCEVNFSH